MKEERIRISGISLPLHSLGTLVVGSGAASLRCALSLHELGQEEIAVATDEWGGGVSFRSGSDKQTYYKMSTSGEGEDSARQMAMDLAAGGSMHGDIALAEAAGSLPAFFDLVRLGVPFPHDRYGAFPGYRTDHDARQRATSAGPYTSRLMAEALAREVRKRKIRIFDRHPVVALLTSGEGRERKVIGALAIDLSAAAGRPGFVAFNAANVVLGTGGPGGIWRDSVYPDGHLGGTGMALAAGATARNLTEVQFGLAALPLRWNLSGSFQQAIPRYVSLDRNGEGEREFLNENFPSLPALADAIFRKGYEWPFDARKAAGGSSLVDLLVFHEREILGRRVYLDYSRNPGCPAGGRPGRRFSLEKLGREAYSFLERSNALRATPISRLRRLNPPAIEVFRSAGIDLGRDLLEIAVSAQHCNGGLATNVWWETEIGHLFAVGEAAGTHGVYRPGGAALNAGQVGARRAALFIARRYQHPPPAKAQFLELAGRQIRSLIGMAGRWLRAGQGGECVDPRPEIQARMSECAGIVRERAKARRAASEAWRQHRWMREVMGVSSRRHLPKVFRDLDLCLTHAFFLEAGREYLERGGVSRGSFLVREEGGIVPAPGLEQYAFSLGRATAFCDTHILELQLTAGGRLKKRWIAVRPLPRRDDWFESLWERFRRDRVIG